MNDQTTLVDPLHPMHSGTSSVRLRPGHLASAYSIGFETTNGSLDLTTEFVGESRRAKRFDKAMRERGWESYEDDRWSLNLGTSGNCLNASLFVEPSRAGTGWTVTATIGFGEEGSCDSWEEGSYSTPMAAAAAGRALLTRCAQDLLKRLQR